MPTTPLYDPDVLFNVLSDIQHAVAVSLNQSNRQVVNWRQVVGWAEPPQDCCPEVAVWGGNLRVDPTSIPNGMARVSCATQWLFDVTIRVSECFLDTDDNGDTLPADTLNGYSHLLYRLMHQTVFGFMCQWTSGTIEELSVFTPMSIGATQEYGEGGCAGIQFTVTVKLD